jgi:hypothetical protein
MSFYTKNFLQKRRSWWMKSIDKVEVLVGSTWYTGAIQKKALEGDAVVIHAVFEPLTAAACTITSLRVTDIDGEVAAQIYETITTAAGQGVLIKLELPITEQEG